MTDLARISIAPDGTHHVIDGRPLYAQRFLAVLKYHLPGLAPVDAEDGAFHVDLAGHQAYSARFRRTFGFYEGLAAVAGADGWFHIGPDGGPRYAERYAWCGNYQDGRCTVRATDGRYLHLDREGVPAYASRWRYAGDFRDAMAVVQADHGRSTHIDPAGAPVHGYWFLDLDAYHKGFARARDDDGWMHIDRAGRPVYRRRFAAVEPYYNGQSRVERFDGGLEVIDPSGATVITLREPVTLQSGAAPLATLPTPCADGSTLLPSSLVRSLSCVSREARRVLFVRHADRDSIPPGSWGNEVPLNRTGERRAAAATTVLTPEPRWAIASSMTRCRQTAALALDTSPGEVATHWLLGSHGPFVVDSKLGRVAFESLSTQGVVRRLIDGAQLEGFRSAAEGTRLVCNWVRELLSERGGSGLLVTHDAIVAPTVAHLFGERFDARWPEFLEGVVFTLDARGGLMAIWDGRSVEVRPC